MPLKKEIARRAGTDDLRKAAAQSGYVPMREQGMDLVLSGVTSLEEMQRVFASKKKSRSAGAR
jgi:type II secretory ATPase GspE/PulE/Tfp pilus assembly ATPase PilB-like protein